MTRVHKAKWVPLGLRANEAPLVKKVIPVLQVILEHKAPSDLKVLLVHKVQKAPRVKWEQPAQWAHKGLAVRSVLKVWRA